MIGLYSDVLFNICQHSSWLIGITSVTLILVIAGSLISVKLYYKEQIKQSAGTNENTLSNLYTYFACLSFCLYPIIVKTADLIGL